MTGRSALAGAGLEVAVAVPGQPGPGAGPVGLAVGVAAAAGQLRSPARQPPVPGMAAARDHPGRHPGTGRGNRCGRCGCAARKNGSAHGWLHQALAAARLHQAGLAGARLAALTGQDYFFRSLMSSHYPGRRVYNADAACALPGLLTELLADSIPARPGRLARLVLLPAVPGFLPAGRLRGARTLLPGRPRPDLGSARGHRRGGLCRLTGQPAHRAGLPGRGSRRTVHGQRACPLAWARDVAARPDHAGQPAQIALNWPPLRPEPATATA